MMLLLLSCCSVYCEQDSSGNNIGCGFTAPAKFTP